MVYFFSLTLKSRYNMKKVWWVLCVWQMATQSEGYEGNKKINKMYMLVDWYWSDNWQMASVLMKEKRKIKNNNTSILN